MLSRSSNLLLRKAGFGAPTRLRCNLRRFCQDAGADSTGPESRIQSPGQDVPSWLQRHLRAKQNARLPARQDPLASQVSALRRE